MTDRMTNEELDAALAEAIGKYTDSDGDRVVLRADEDGITLCGALQAWPDLSPGWVNWSPSTCNGDFSDIEHWIEQRGWPWRSSYEPLTKLYYYMVHNLELPQIGHAIGRESRMRAGCIAFLRALGEGRDG